MTTDFLLADQPPFQKLSIGNAEPWHILVVDDEPSVHDITRLILSHMEIFDKPVKLHSAYSAEEAKGLLESNEFSFCMAFIDIVMETPSAGLDLVDWIRNDRKNSAIRLVLRTGQPGSAPETEVVRRYDINDYRAKTDLTSQTLSTCVFSAIRGYRDITALTDNVSTLRRLIDNSANLLKENSLNQMTSAAFKSLLNILNTESSSLYITYREYNCLNDKKDIVYFCSNHDPNTREGDFSTLPEDVRNAIDEAYDNKRSKIDEKQFIGYFSTSHNSGSVIYVEYDDDPTHFHANIVEMFASQTALIFENLSRQTQLENAQKELMYIVGDALDARNLETGKRVKRIALYCDLLARKLKQPESFINAVKISAPLHDIGKITIPETILLKQTELTPEEWEVMKTHAAAGGSILEKSNLPIAQFGARLARWHHESWDGSGFPDGLKGEEIPLEARIMALADVFDALGTSCGYKTPWPDQDIYDYIIQQQGIKFDPTLVDVFKDNFEALIILRNQYPD
ncbi:MAG: DUF3369 domain-containing protein [Reinekea sp.]